MHEPLGITALARKTHVSSKALRYWEALGLLPRAARSHTRYRLFPAETVAYVGFIKRSKEVGLTLEQMKTVLALARAGRSPCEEVEAFIDRRIVELEDKIASLSELLQSLKALRACDSARKLDRDRSKECCSLLMGLPEARPFSAGSEGRSYAASGICDGGG